jgi:hypothetical protein
VEIIALNSGDEAGGQPKSVRRRLKGRSLQTAANVVVSLPLIGVRPPSAIGERAVETEPERHENDDSSTGSSIGGGRGAISDEGRRPRARSHSRQQSMPEWIGRVEEES